MSEFHIQSHPENIPPPSLMQQYSQFMKNGGNSSDFAMTAGADNDRQLVVATVQKIGESISFLTQNILAKNNGELIQEMRERIARTMVTIGGIKKSPHDSEENLGTNFPGNY